MSDDNLFKTRSRRWQIRDRASIFFTLGGGVGHWVFNMRNPDGHYVAVFRFSGVSGGLGGGFNFNVKSMFDSQGWATINNLPASISLEDLDGADGSLKIVGASALLDFTEITVEAWKFTESGFKRPLIRPFTIGGYGVETPSPNMKPGISVALVAVVGKWSVDKSSVQRMT